MMMPLLAFPRSGPTPPAPWRSLAGACALLLLLAAFPAYPQADALPLHQIRLPAGFRIALLARVPNARQMALGDRMLFVGSMHEGKVYALPLPAPDRAGKPIVVARDLALPSGVAYRGGSLYIAAVDRVLRIDDIERQIESRPDVPPAASAIAVDLPADRHHGWKFIAFGPDGKLYVPVGAPCNVCEPDPSRYATILRMNPDGSGRESFARGVRNSVGFDWQPGSGDLWFTDNGRDRLGDDAPPDELNRAPRAGMHFGYPYCHGGDLPDPDFGRRRACSEFEAPAQKLGAHVAALGMRFYTGRQFPAEYRDQIFIAEHGSWNRSRKTGYRISLVRLRDRQAVAYAPFAEGWLQGETAWGRPSDVLVMRDGSLLVADDLAGAIYRISYQP